MPGLLDFNDPQTRMGLGLLALGQAPRAQGFQGLLGLMANEGAMKQQDMQRQVMQSQIDENKVQNRQRELQMQNAMAQQARENAFFGMGGAQPTTQGAGMIGGAPAVSGASAMPSEGKFDEWSKQYGIPKDALVVDFIKNGGKGIAEMLAKRGTPDMQVTNGYAYDKNRLGAGYLPQLNISNDGKATQVQIGPDGLPVVSAPRGAPETFGTYQGIQAGIQSANTPIKVFNPQTQREEFTRQSSVLQGASPTNYAGAGYAGGSQQAAAQGQLEVMQSELNKLPANHPDRPAIMREMALLGGQPAQSGNFAAGPSAQEVAANDAARTRAVDTAKADVVRDTGKQSENKLANKLTTGVDRALELLQQGPTSSVVGNLADKGMGAFGMSTKSGETAAQLEALSGWLVSNVPRMEGPQSNIDVQNYQTMAGRIGDRNLPIGTRKAAAEEVKRLQSKYAELNGGASDAPAQQRSAAGTWNGAPVPKVPMKGQVIGGFKFKGGNPADPSNWEQSR